MSSSTQKPSPPSRGKTVAPHEPRNFLRRAHLESLKCLVRRQIYANPVLRICWSKAGQIRDEFFEFWNGIDSTGKHPVDNLTLKGSHGPEATTYQAVGVRVFRHALSSLIIDYSQYCFIDFGSGKGRAVLMASRYPFKKVIGIEFAKELHELALKNLKAWRWKKKCGSVEFLWIDALEFEIPAGPCVLFFFNPFGPGILTGVLENVQQSMKAWRREIIVIYVNPKHESAILSLPNGEQISKSAYYHYGIYRIKPPF